MKKIAIVTGGGGIACAYSAGVILALVEKFGLVEPYLVIGSSASTGTLAYYVARQYDSLKNVWENLVPSKKLIFPWRLTKILDIDYLIDDILRKQEPLDVEKIKLSRIKFLISVTDIESGRLKYFSNRENVDIFEALRASIDAPLAYNRSVRINGHKYIDGAIRGTLIANIHKAKEEGAEGIIAIDNATPETAMDTVFRLYSLFQSKSFRNEAKHYFEHQEYPESSEVMILKPRVTLPVGKLDNRRSGIVETIQIGYNDVVNSSTLIKKFLFG